MSTSKCYNLGCGKAGEKRCSQCQSVFYCDEQCQRSDWKEHRLKCKAIKKQRDAEKRKGEGSSTSAFQLPSPSAWAVGLSPSLQREWLVDCYRMLVDDEYAYCGDIRAGSLYDPDHSPKDVVQDFLVFCRLALEQGVLPEDWNWSAFLAIAADLIPFAFEKRCKRDAREKYGFENFFQGAFPGSRSLRYTGETIYGSGILEGRESELHEKVQMEVLNKKRTKSMVANVGEKKSWDILEAKLMRKL